MFITIPISTGLGYLSIRHTLIRNFQGENGPLSVIEQVIRTTKITHKQIDIYIYTHTCTHSMKVEWFYLCALVSSRASPSVGVSSGNNILDLISNTGEHFNCKYLT